MRDWDEDQQLLCRSCCEAVNTYQDLEDQLWIKCDCTTINPSDSEAVPWTWMREDKHKVSALVEYPLRVAPWIVMLLGVVSLNYFFPLDRTEGVLSVLMVVAYVAVAIILMLATIGALSLLLRVKPIAGSLYWQDELWNDDGTVD